MAEATYTPRNVDRTSPRDAQSLIVDRSIINKIDDLVLYSKNYANLLDLLCIQQLEGRQQYTLGAQAVVPEDAAEAILFASARLTDTIRSLDQTWDDYRSGAYDPHLAGANSAHSMDPMLAAIERYRAAVAEDDARFAAGQTDETAAERTITPLWKELRARPPVTTTFAGAAAALHHLMEDGTVTDQDSGLVSSVIDFLERRSASDPLAH